MAMTKLMAIATARTAKELYGDAFHRLRPRQDGDAWVIDCWTSPHSGFLAKEAIDIENHFRLLECLAEFPPPGIGVPSGIPALDLQPGDAAALIDAAMIIEDVLGTTEFVDLELGTGRLLRPTVHQIRLLIRRRQKAMEGVSVCE